MTEVISQYSELKGRLFKDDNYNLTIRCDEKNVVVKNFQQIPNVAPGSVLNRKDGCWFLCYTWTRTWLTDSVMGGKGDPDAKSSSVFVNLKTGETHTTHSFLLFRSHHTFSSDNNFLLIQGGICASGASEIILLDLRDLAAVNVVFREEIWEVPHGCQFSFNENSDETDLLSQTTNLSFKETDLLSETTNLIATYSYEFFEYKGKRVCGEYDLDEIKKMVNPSNPNNIGDGELWRAGVTFNPVSVTVIRQVDPLKVTPPSDLKWTRQEFVDTTYAKRFADYEAQGLDLMTIQRKIHSEPRSDEEIAHIKKTDSKYGSRCTVNEMKEIKIIKSDNFDRFIENVENPFNYTY